MDDLSSAVEAQDRREFLHRMGGGALGAWLTLNLSACQEASEYAREATESGLPFTVLSAEEGRQVEAVCATLIPSDDTPGAAEAGAAHFIDRVLGTFESAALPSLREGLGGLTTRVADGEWSGSTFADLSPDERITVMEAVEQEDPGFFGRMLFLTICGTLCHPDMGGNREEVGWELLGMQVESGYQPPFGYYDRGHHGQESVS